jgi:hypothetical protein
MGRDVRWVAEVLALRGQNGATFMQSQLQEEGWGFQSGWRLGEQGPLTPCGCGAMCGLVPGTLAPAGYSQ